MSQQTNISFVVTDEDRQALKEIAGAMHFNSVSSLIREAVLEYARDNNFDFRWSVTSGKHKKRDYLDVSSHQKGS